MIAEERVLDPLARQLIIAALSASGGLSVVFVSPTDKIANKKFIALCKIMKPLHISRTYRKLYYDNGTIEICTPGIVRKIVADKHVAVIIDRQTETMPQEDLDHIIKHQTSHGLLPS